MWDMEKVLDKTQPNSEFFRPKARFLVSLHGTFDGETFVYCVAEGELHCRNRQGSRGLD